MKTRAFILIIGSALFTFSLARHISAAEPQVIKLERFRKALWKAHVKLNGKEGDFLFDTGGGATFVTDSFAKGIDCEFWGRRTGYNMFGKRSEEAHCDEVRLSAGDVKLANVSIGKIDFNGQFPGDKPPDGLLALDAFDGMAITIDQQRATVTIETPESLNARIHSGIELPLRVGRECSGRCLSAFLGVKTPKGMTWWNVDTGAGGVSLVSNDHAALFGLTPGSKDQNLKYQLTPQIMLDGAAMTTDMIMDGNVGQPFLSQYVVTLDLRNSRAWFALPARTRP